MRMAERMASDGLLGGSIGYWVLQNLCHPSECDNNNFEPAPENWEDKLQREFGPVFLSAVREKVVLDYGCGFGQATMAIARMGARVVIGTDIREDVLNRSRSGSAQAN